MASHLDSFKLTILFTNRVSRACRGTSNKHNASPKGDALCFTYRMYFVYMIKNSANKLYVGITTNPDDRVMYHNQKRGARFTKYSPDFQIVFLERYETLASARKREIQIKKWRREKKEFLIEKFQKGTSTKL